MCKQCFLLLPIKFAVFVNIIDVFGLQLHLRTAQIIENHIWSGKDKGNLQGIYVVF